MCQVLGVSKSGYYHWRKREKSNQPLRREELTREIKKFEHNYDVLSNSQKYALGMSINLLKSSVQLLINPLLGL